MKKLFVLASVVVISGCHHNDGSGGGLTPTSPSGPQPAQCVSTLVVTGRDFRASSQTLTLEYQPVTSIESMDRNGAAVHSDATPTRLVMQGVRWGELYKFHAKTGGCNVWSDPPYEWRAPLDGSHPDGSLPLPSPTPNPNLDPNQPPSSVKFNSGERCVHGPFSAGGIETGSIYIGAPGGRVYWVTVTAKEDKHSLVNEGQTQEVLVDITIDGSYWGETPDIPESSVSVSRTTKWVGGVGTVAWRAPADSVHDVCVIVAEE